MIFLLRAKIAGGCSHAAEAGGTGFNGKTRKEDRKWLTRSRIFLAGEGDG
jgi:hypothetical protein